MVAVASSTLERPKQGKTRRKVCILFGLVAAAICILFIEGQSLSIAGLETIFIGDSTTDVSPVELQSDLPLPSGLVVAYAVSITYCHPDDFIADAAAVLQHSIHLVSLRQSNSSSDNNNKNNPTMMSRYDYQMYAFVHPDAQNCTQSLRQLGYKILIKETPVAPSEMRNEELRQDATTTGCCQEKEFLKLYALTLTDHPIVVHVDLDCLILQPLDPLFDAMMLPDSQNYYHRLYGAGGDNIKNTTPSPSIRKYVPDAMWSSYKTIPITSYFVRDYNMIKKGNPIPPNRVNMQGGFWIVKPHQAVFDEFCEVLRDGHGYSQTSGWGGTQQLAPSHYYGVAQIQGLVSYYYGFVRPGSSVELNKCFYNNMVDNPQRRQSCQQQQQQSSAAETTTAPSGPCQDCRYTPLDQIRSIHLTLCQKPWWCPLWIEEPQCSKFHYEWHRIREDFEARMLSKRVRRTTRQVDTSNMKQVLGRFPRHCRRQGSKGYRPIEFARSPQSVTTNEGMEDTDADLVIV